ncbi:molybdenum cofactor biosysynthesis protein [Catenuloplanes sp. NPDC051500]|uniref:molybdenum cofactor biosysynthesis protein n=1 Tax=Catenuloplanes sp. NPDC051500 TaxID=3363959 RepID=UPI0037B2A841
MTEIAELLASPVHRLAGRPKDGPAPAPPGELRTEIHIRAGIGIVGDRFFGHPAHHDASVTMIAREHLPPGAGLAEVRRNVLLTGVPVDDLIGTVLTLDSGAGPIRLRVNSAAHPCAWMDVTIAPGAWRALRGHGGIRCTPLDDGILRVGPVKVDIRR